MSPFMDEQPPVKTSESSSFQTHSMNRLLIRQLTLPRPPGSPITKPARTSFCHTRGYIVDTSTDTAQWENAASAMDILDAGDVPYSVGPVTTIGNGFYDTYFGIDRFSGKTNYAGYYGGETITTTLYSVPPGWTLSLSTTI